MAFLDDVASITRQVQFAWMTSDDTGLSGMVIAAPGPSAQHLQTVVQPGLSAYGAKARMPLANGGMALLLGGDGGLICTGGGPVRTAGAGNNGGGGGGGGSSSSAADALQKLNLAPTASEVTTPLGVALLLATGGGNLNVSLTGSSHGGGSGGGNGSVAGTGGHNSPHPSSNALLQSATGYGDDTQYAQSFDISMSPRLDFLGPARRHVGKSANEHPMAQTKVVNFKDLGKGATGGSSSSSSSSSSSGASKSSSGAGAEGDAFARVAVPTSVGPATAPSKLSQLLKSTASSGGKNTFSEYSQFSGEGHVGIARTVKLEIFFPTAKDTPAIAPINIIALGTATVEQVLGLIMWKYTKDDRQPKLAGNMDSYCLRMVEDDGTPDMDFPALDRKQPIQKFGFDQLAFCEGPRFNRNTRRIMRPESKHTTTFVHVYLPNQGCSIVSVKSFDVLLKDVLANVRKKRQLPKDQHTLELVDAPGEELDLNQTLQSIGTTKFNLIHKFSKRMDLVDADAVADKQKTDDVDFSLTVHQYKSFFVYIKHKFSANQEVMLGIDGNKVDIIPQSTQGFFAKTKLVSYQMDDIVLCQPIDEKSKTLKPGVSTKSFRFVYYNGNEFKSNYFDAKGAEEAKEIVTKINYILQSRVSETRALYAQQQDDANKKAKKL
ncbi:hypothetical protein CAOG_00876 [Capsaspora owczarzaki ATCC 30864]|uniref:Target of rapamycin complex 2 subunit MAPKAP1 n=1 Tax=Capsaspora owczarzaki (strain ATCC 30864) TaxID=595528 RepID=A0A0D2WJA0_CAPO3|nr:hypothetical protein CAOG_00876 [Capsaspora owczarzaki ATCC 30864]KJE89398.1 hypothetical protein CAOG_000876 [Capsaspora owczarzaki ATCC 30864]|eukprot:XP_004365747.1 hypothetical protein CAOG_00876 [Capsaspora owczarzaki ATCC 30864]